MPTSYITLSALIKELHPILSNSNVYEIFTQQKDELILSFSNNENRDAEKASGSLLISVNPKLNYIFLRDRVSRAKTNSVDLFGNILNQNMGNVSLCRKDRTIKFEFQNDLTLFAQMYNSAESNIILVNKEHSILEAFKHNKILNGTRLHIEERAFDSNLINDFSLFKQKLISDAAKTIFTNLRNIAPFLGTNYSREILHRARVEEKKLTKDLNTEEMETIHEILQNIIKCSGEYNPVIYYKDSIPKVMSMIPMEHLIEFKPIQFGSVNKAVNSFILETIRFHTYENEKNLMLQNFKNELERLEHLQQSISKQIERAGKADEYQHIGKIIIANIKQLKKGIKEIILADIFNENKPVLVSLDPELTPPENAELYFNKSKKAKLTQSENKKKIEKFKSRIYRLEQLQMHLAQCGDRDQVKKFLREYSNELKSTGFTVNAGEEKKLPFRVFIVAGGFKVWVGKNSRNNDLLTMKYAKPNDLWFHVRGMGGSHTVLKVEGKKPFESKEAIRQTAGIAAYYSKMRNASNVPVAYCERKYVRKTKGLSEGAVFLEREKIIFVQPALP